MAPSDVPDAPDAPPFERVKIEADLDHVGVFGKVPLRCVASVGDSPTFAWSTTFGTIVGTGSDVILHLSTDGDATVTCTATGVFQASAELHLSIPLPQGSLAAYYPFDGDGVDASGNLLDAQLHGTTFVPDRHGLRKAVRVGPNDPPIALPRNVAFDPGNDTYTIAFFASSEGGTSNVLLGQENGTDIYAIRIVPSGAGNVLELSYPDDFDSNITTMIATATPITATPAHFAFVVSPQAIQVFRDGQPTDQLANPPARKSDLNDLHIGDPDGLGTWLGTIDELRFYTRALAPEEVAAIATSPAH